MRPPLKKDVSFWNPSLFWGGSMLVFVAPFVNFEALVIRQLRKPWCKISQDILGCIPQDRSSVKTCHHVRYPLGPTYCFRNPGWNYWCFRVEPRVDIGESFFVAERFMLSFILAIAISLNWCYPKPLNHQKNVNFAEGNLQYWQCESSDKSERKYKASRLPF